MTDDDKTELAILRAIAAATTPDTPAIVQVPGAAAARPVSRAGAAVAREQAAVLQECVAALRQAASKLAGLRARVEALEAGATTLHPELQAGLAKAVVAGAREAVARELSLRAADPELQGF